MDRQFRLYLSSSGQRRADLSPGLSQRGLQILSRCLRVGQHAAFVPLRLLPAYTMLEGAMEPKAIAMHAHANLAFPQPRCAIVTGSMRRLSFRRRALIRVFSRLSAPCCAWNGRIDLMSRRRCDWLVLLAQDERATTISALSFPWRIWTGRLSNKHVTFDQLEGWTDSLICLTAGGEGGAVPPACRRTRACGFPICRPFVAAILRTPLHRNLAASGRS